MPVIKAIWNKLLEHPVIERAILHDSSKNVASFSLMTLAVFDVTLDTTMPLVYDALIANQKITLQTYNCVLRRLYKCNLTNVDARHVELGMSAVEMIWDRTLEILQTTN